MHELISEALVLVNLPFTVLFGFVIVYWGLVILGALDIDALDIGLDLDADADVAGESGFGKAVGHFFHVDEGPFMAIASLLFVFLWMGSMLLNHHFNPSHSLLLGAALLVPNMVLSVIGTKAVVLPFFKVFRRFSAKEEPAEVPLLGQICHVVTLEVTQDSGQAEVNRKGAPLKINVRTGREGDVIRKGEDAVIISENKENNTYLIKKLEE